MFRFESGGRHHFQGYGEWIVEFTTKGQMKIQQFVGNNLKVDKEFTVKSPEKETLTKFISEFPLDRVYASTRPGVPDEPQLVFIIQKKTPLNPIEIRIWLNDATKIPFLKEFLNKIKDSIKIYIGTAPVI